MNCRKIIKEYLKENGYEGLYNPNDECACKKDELFTCANYCGDCRPGYLKLGNSEYDFSIEEEKESIAEAIEKW